MFNEKKGKLLRIYISEHLRHDNRPLYEWLLLKARELHMSGATVLRGIEGYGASSGAEPDWFDTLDQMPKPVYHFEQLRREIYAEENRQNGGRGCPSCHYRQHECRESDDSKTPSCHEGQAKDVEPAIGKSVDRKDDSNPEKGQHDQ